MDERFVGSVERKEAEPALSERLAALEASLRERERQLEEAQRIARVGAWRWVRATDETTWSNEVYRVFGLEPSGAAPSFETICAMHPPRCRARLEEGVRRAIETGEPYEYDMEILAADGTVKWIIAKGEVESFADGEVAVLRGTVQDITERKLAEQRVLRSEMRYRSLVSASSEIVWVTNAEGAAVDANREWSAFTGQTQEELHGFGWVEAIHPDDRARTLAAWQHSIATGELFEIEHRLRRHDGVYRTMSVRGVASRDEEGKIYEWVGMDIDVTEKIEAEAKASATQSRFQRLYDSDLMGIGFPEASGVIREANDALLRLVGYTREDSDAGLVRWDAITPAEYRELDLARIQEAAETGRCTPYQKEYIRKDGSRVPILCGFARLGGASTDSIGFVLDLSAQRLAEREAVERENRFSALADSLPQLVWMTDETFANTYCNQRLLDYTGLSMDEMMGVAWKELVHPDDLERTVSSVEHCRRTGEPYLVEYRLRRHDGAYRSFLARAVPVRNEAGVIEHWLGSATDIHDQKIAEEALRRTEKLAATGRLAASIAHEINNPLEAVTNALYLALMDEGLEESTRMYLTMAERELGRVAHVTTQTLRFHRQSTAPVEADFAELMDSAFDLYAARFDSCRIAVSREYKAGQMIFCRGDEVRQVFANLLSNALDATRKGGRLRIRIHPAREWRGEERRGLRVVVADTGDGVPVEMRRTIFEPFVSTKDSTGTGLGLWVSEGIVQKHGGHMALHSRTGARHGTVFSLFFPFDGIKPAGGLDGAGHLA
jgi:PAS domain S-box-containing protein